MAFPSSLAVMSPVNYLVALIAFGVALFAALKIRRALAEADSATTDDGCDQHSLSVVADEISSEDLALFNGADTVSFAVRETNHLDTRFFWVNDFEHGRLYARALFIALGIAPAQLVEVFGFASGAEGSGVAFWDDLGAIPLKVVDTGMYNTEPFQRLADLLGKNISVELESKPLSKVKQCPTKLFVVKCKTAIRVAG